MEPWKAVTKATLNFRLPAKTATNVTWTVPKDGQGKGQCRFKPSTLALSEMKHFMGVANVDRPHATSRPGEYGLILPKDSNEEGDYGTGHEKKGGHPL